MKQNSFIRKMIPAILLVCILTSWFFISNTFSSYKQEINLPDIDLSVNGTNVPDYLTVTVKPDKTDYLEGESFDKTGMEVTVTYTDGTSAVVDNYTISDGKDLPEGKSSVTISYSENGVTVTTKQPITVVTVQPILAASDTWFTQGGTTIKRSSITEIEIVDSYKPSGAVVDFWDASAAKDGSVMAYVEEDGSGNGTYKVTIAGNGYGCVYANPDSSYAFSDTKGSDLFSNLTTITGGSVLDTNMATNMKCMFGVAAKLVTVDVSNWDTDSVTDMSYMFYLCSALETLDVGNWNTGNVTTLYCMFPGCTSLLSLDLSNWNVSNVTNMSYMFMGEDNAHMTITSIGNVENWNTGKVTTMTHMFTNCEKLTTVGVTNWDTSNVRDMSFMFAGCRNIETLNVANWNTSKVTSMQAMFELCSKLRYLDVANWNVGKVTDFSRWLNTTTNDIDNVIAEIDVSKWDVSSVTDMSAMFYGCAEWTSVDVSNWDVSKVKNMSHMFSNCRNLETLDVSKWTTTALTNVNAIFNDCRKVSTIDVGIWNTNKVTDFGQLFENCYALENIIGLDNWNTVNGMNFYETFSGCRKLTALDLSSWDTSSAVYMGRMFNGCSSLATIYATDRFVAADGTGVSVENQELVEADMFLDCVKLIGGAGTKFDADVIDTTYAKVDGGAENPGYLTNNIFLAYTDLMVGEEGSPALTVKSKVHTASDSAIYEIVSGSEFISIDPTNGKVTGKAEGTAIVKVTLTATNGDTITAQGTVKVSKTVPILAPQDTWFTQGGTTIKRSSITEIEIVDSYKPSGTVVDSWDASAAKDGSVMVYVEDDGSGNGTYKLTISGNGSGKVFANPDSTRAFSDVGKADYFSNLTTINGGSVLDTSMVTNMSNMFRSAVKLTSINVSDWDTSNVTSMEAMFSGSSSAGNMAIQTLDLSKWNTGKVENMAAMFQLCSNITSLDVSEWDTGSCTTMQHMFSGCSSLGALDVSNWDTGACTTMSTMFQNCSKLAYLDVSNWDTGSCTDMQYMFNKCSQINNLDTSKWNTAAVTNMKAMFQNCSSLETLDVSKWNTAQVGDMSAMFNNCINLETLDVSNWNVGNVKTMRSMFQLCPKLQSLNVANWNVGKVTDFGYWLNTGSNEVNTVITEIDVSKWDTSSVTDMMFMFYGCNKWSYVDVSNWDVSKVETMDHMFSNCRNLQSLDVSKWTTTALTDMNGMFNDCQSLTTINVSSFNTSKVTIFNQIFEFCYNLQNIVGLENWDTSNGTHFYESFSDCRSLSELDLSSWDTSSAKFIGRMFNGCNNMVTIYATDMFVAADGTDVPAEDLHSVCDDMFLNCVKLIGGAGTAYDSNVIDATYAKIDGGTKDPGYFTDPSASNLIITKQPTDFIGLAGSTVSFSVSVNQDNATYQWQYSTDGGANWKDSVASGYNTNTVSTTLETHRDEWLYRCVVTSATGDTVTSKSAQIILTDVLLEITTQPVDYVGNVGDIATFSVEVNKEDVSYQWQYSTDSGVSWKNSTTTGSTTSTASITVTDSRFGWKYRCIITDSDGASLTTDVATIILDDNNQLAILTQPVDFVCNIGETMSFTVEVNRTDVTYQWQYSKDSGSTWINSTASGATTANIHGTTLTASRIGWQYRCIITDSAENTVISDVASFLLAESDPLEITEQPTDFICADGSIATFTVVATRDDVTYQWQYSSDNGIFWVNSTKETATTATIKDISVTAARSGWLYRCIITDSTGASVTSDTAAIIVTTDALTIISQPVDLTCSLGNTASFTVSVNQSDVTYQWQWRTGENGTWYATTVSGNTTDTISMEATETQNGYQYRCVITDAKGNQVISDVVILTVANEVPGLEITKQPEDYAGHLGDKMSFTVEVNKADVTYQWEYSPDGGKTWKASGIASAKTANINGTEITEARIGWQYRCIITDSEGNRVTSEVASIVLASVEEALAITKPPDDITAVLGETVTFSVEAEGESLSYQW